MSWGPLLVNLGVTAVTVAVLMLATFAYAIRTRVHAIMDTVWALGFVIIALVSFLLSIGHGRPGGGCWCWFWWRCGGAAPGAYLPPEPRAGRGQAVRVAAAAQHGEPGPLRAALHLLDAGAGDVVRVAAVAGGNVRACFSGDRYVAGVAVWAVGFGFETVGDWQLRRWRASPSHAGRVLDRGLWRYTRHPNYFGDAVVWFGLWLLACSHWLGFVLVASPAYMTNMLVRHTGKRLLEKHMARSKGTAYADYVSRTSGFFPWPPRRPARS
jgi:steroid 5-alpha reductase family enzyme